MTALPRRELLAGHPRALELEPILQAAERSLRTWQPSRTGFLDAALREEAERLVASLSELAVAADGGFAGAERCQLVFSRRDSGVDPLPGDVLAPAGPEQPDAPLAGLELAGNFLFDPASPTDFRALLRELRAADAEVGDLWVRGDRGAQGVVSADLARRLDGCVGLLRQVPVRCERRSLDDLRPPQPAAPRQLSTVEASTRLDALASAGFGLSRSRMAGLIRAGAVRVNWQPVQSPSRLLQEGDRVQLEGRGELEILGVAATQRGRLRVAMRRGGR